MPIRFRPSSDDELDGQMYEYPDPSPDGSTSATTATVRTSTDVDPGPGGTARTLRTEFHHIGLIFSHPTDPWPLLAGALGARFVASGRGPGYGWTQLVFANGFHIEGIHPEDLEPATLEGGFLDPGIVCDTPTEGAFIGRFLQEHGPGPHHLTFSVDDLDTAQVALERSGIHPIRLDHDEPFCWSELLIRPKEGHGVLIQLLDDLDRRRDPYMEPPEGFPEPSIDAPVASLGRVVHAVRDLDGALQLFRDGLGGHVVSNGCAVDGNHWVELSWGGNGHLRLLEATRGDIAEWIGHRQGRVRHLFFNFDEPEYVPGAEMVSPGRWVVPKENILGTRLVLSSSARLALENA